MRLTLAGLFLFALVFSQCTPNNVKQDDSLKSFFEEYKAEGCFALLDNGTGDFTIYNLPRYRDSIFTPASTFKIVNSLIGLQTGAISSDTMVIQWDGITRNISDWNRDLTMREAFRVSSVPYYQEVARRIGKDSMETWLNRVKYGARSDKDTIAIQSAIDTFWLDNTLKVTPDQQLGLVKQLYFNQLPFFKVHQETVKSVMKMEDTPEYRLAYKTGWTGWDEKTGRHIGWIVGWIEENNHPYFFVLNIESKDRDFNMREARLGILKGILKKLDFMQGKM
ncbi:MAG: penicillin-binding transpeptidase domain-containing protein [Chitinophagaceae bacterium]|nr:penicillin-binding transpeptidase domain-containing protein [Chitinophagaceae bacterium]